MADFKMTWNGPEVALKVDHKKVTGEVVVVFTSSGHCHISSYRDGDTRPGRLYYRDDSWYASLHLFAASGWGESRHADGHNDPGEYFHNPTSDSREMAPSYRARVIEALTKAVSEFTAENPAILVEADRNQLEHQLADTQKKIKELSRELAAAQDTATKLIAQLKALPATS